MSTTTDPNREHRVLMIEQLRAYLTLQQETLDELTGRWSAGLYYHPGPYAEVKEDLARWIRAMKARGARITKDYGSDEWATVRVEAKFPADVSALGTVTALASRSDVCERVEIGQRTVTETVPDPELVADVPLVEVTRTVTDYRWECSPLMGDAA